MDKSPFDLQKEAGLLAERLFDVLNCAFPEKEKAVNMILEFVRRYCEEATSASATNELINKQGVKDLVEAAESVSGCIAPDTFQGISINEKELRIHLKELRDLLRRFKFNEERNRHD